MISFWSILYLLIIRPIEMLIETVFSICYVNSGNALFSLIMLSIVISLTSAGHCQSVGRERTSRPEPSSSMPKKNFSF